MFRRGWASPHLADREPFALSGGEQQRVAIASVVVMGTRRSFSTSRRRSWIPRGPAPSPRCCATWLRTARHPRRRALPRRAVRTRECLGLEAGPTVAPGRPAEALAAQPYAPTLVQLALAAGLAPESAFDEIALADALRSGRRAAVSNAPRLALEVPAAAGGGPAAIEVRGLVHSYPGGVTALRGVNLSIAPGESIAIVGQNGSGKTTLVKHFNGLLRPEAGSVVVGGEALGRRRVSDLAGEVGFVFQNPDDQLFQSRVDREVAFGPRNLQRTAAEIERLVGMALGLVGLTDESGTNPYDLGLSVRKLVALASVLAMEPGVLVLDEPTTGQDGPGVERVGAIVDAWSAAGRSVVAVTHDMEFAARHFRRIVIMRQGEIVLDGPPDVAFGPANVDLLASTGLRPRLPRELPR